MHVICDFDGTTTTPDMTDLVLDRLAYPVRREVEEAWLANRISAAECMRGRQPTLGAGQSMYDAAALTLLDALFRRCVAD